MGFNEELEATKRKLIADKDEQLRQEEVAFREHGRQLAALAEILRQEFGEGRIRFEVQREIPVAEWGETTGGIKVFDEGMPIGGVFLNPHPLFHPFDFYSSQQVGPCTFEEFPSRLKQHVLKAIAEFEVEMEAVARAFE